MCEILKFPESLRKREIHEERNEMELWDEIDKHLAGMIFNMNTADRIRKIKWILKDLNEESYCSDYFAFKDAGIKIQVYVEKINND